MAVKCKFQALTLAEAQEEILVYEPICGRGQPKATKPPSPGFVKVLMRLDYSPGEFWQRGKKNRLSYSYGDNHDKFQDGLL